LRRWLIGWADSHGYNIYADGLVVRTTIDSRLQKMAVDALTRQADKLQAAADKAWAKPTRNKQLLQALIRETPQYRDALAAGMNDEQALKKLQADAAFIKAMWHDKTHLQAAFLAQDPATGQVKAWVGSRDFRQDQFDHVQQARRQPGSTFKPFVYGAAFEDGIDPNEMFIDEAVEYRIDANTVWKPGDVHETTGLPTTLRDGLVHSKNSITAQLGQRVGAARIAQVAQAMGVRQSKLDEVPSLALGTSPVTLKEMVSAYCTIADSGRYIEPVLVLRIENRKHQVLQEFHPRPPEQALQLAASQTLLDVMRGVVDVGTGAGIRSRFGLKGDLAGKTGTTQDNTDGWFILMHPQLVAGAWVGFNDQRITMGDAWGQGARNALLIVGDFFQETTKANLVSPKAKFAAPHLPPEPSDPSVLARINDWLSRVIQPEPPVQSQPEPAIVVMPAPSMNEPPAIAAQPPDYPWRPQRPPIVIRTMPESSAAELGAGPQRPYVEPRNDERSAPSAEQGIRILRAY
jgi:penicillin-binding protein 1A